jgi:hypothetical protein
MQQDELVVSLSDGSQDTLGLIQTDEATPLQEDSGKFLTIRSNDYDVEKGEEPEYYIRHLAQSVVLTTLNGNNDKKNGAWIKATALCPPGEGECPAAPKGSTECFSLESADHQGDYLAKMPNDDYIGLRALPFADVVSATFCVKPGHSNEQHATYESLAKPGFFITHVQFSLMLCNNVEDSKCGMHEHFDRMSTFEEMPSTFYGRCLKTSDGGGRCTCLENFVGKACNLECPGGCSSGECKSKNDDTEAYCLCKPGFVGSKCTLSCPTSEATGIICGAAGPKSCSLQDGNPVCDCGVGFKGEACQYHCAAFDEEAGTVCNNQGNCSLIEDPGSRAVGARGTECTCTPEYIGGSCQLTCPKGPKGVCGGEERGKCVLDDEDGVATCECHEGYAGATCHFDCPRDAAGIVCAGHGTCAQQAGGTAPPTCTCERGFAGDACQATCPGMLAGTHCSGHGRCFFSANAPIDDTEPEAGTAEAEAQEVVDAEMSEETTESEPTKQASRKLLQATNETAAANTTTNRTAITRPGAMCTCERGFGGKGCGKVCLRDPNGQICSGHGACDDDAKCICQEGFTGPSCRGVCPGTENGGEPCSGNGDCTWNPVAETAQCECKEGFMGTSCAAACPRGGEQLQVCSGKGQCLMSRGAPICMCEEGIKGKACQLSCPGAAEQSVCAGHGFCHANTDETKAKCKCAKGYLGSGCASGCPGVAEGSSACSGRGTCNAGETDADPAWCQCKPGYLGRGCEVKCPTDEFGNICSGAGECSLRTSADDVESAECKCAPGRVNFNCDTACPSNTADGTVCSGHGECDIEQRTNEFGEVRLAATCKCHEGFLGNDCFHGCPTAPGNNADCSGHGVCKLQGGAAVCQCGSGYSGKDCNERVCGSMNSFFNDDIEKCTCEAGYTCCSREGSGTDKERDVAIEALQRENKLMMGKIRVMKRSLSEMVAESSA